MTNQNTYPIQQLTPNSTDPEKEQAVMATVQQLMAEGMTQEQAQNAALQMLQQMQPMQDQMMQKESMNMGPSMMNPNSIFARGNGGASAGADSKYQKVPNVRLNKFNPLREGGYQRVN